MTVIDVNSNDDDHGGGGGGGNNDNNNNATVHLHLLFVNWGWEKESCV